MLWDFNVNWIEKSNNKKLHEVVSQFDLSQLIQSPSKVTSSSQTQIDLIFRNKSERITISQ